MGKFQIIMKEKLKNIFKGLNKASQGFRNQSELAFRKILQ